MRKENGKLNRLIPWSRNRKPAILFALFVFFTHTRETRTNIVNRFWRDKMMNARKWTALAAAALMLLAPLNDGLHSWASARAEEAAGESEQQTQSAEEAPPAEAPA